MQFDTTILEFDKVKVLIKNKAETVLGKALVQEMTPSNNRLQIKLKLNETAHALRILMHYKTPPFGGIRDLSETLKKAQIYSVLRANEFLDIIGLIDATGNNVRFYKQVKELEINETYLDEYFNQLEAVPSLKKSIQMVITEDGYVSDSASNDLRRIRNQINIKQNRVKEKLNQIVQRESSSLVDTIVTFRNNRFVVPVKLSEKNNFKGTIIDYSSSGETVFMEPLVINEINNEISALLIEEEREVERILRELTILVANHYYPLSNNLKLLCQIDAIFAKAKFALDFECTMPEITENEVDLIKARHPLIPQEAVVANTIRFNEGERLIIVTGPNTGGKTVALKTMGLLSIMVQSGMLIPVKDESKTIIFENIFADIGDEQSIEQSLSTFSSHMTRIIHIIDHMSHGSLVLLDELGSGTDPKEGASLAISILEYLRVRGIYVIATTHYPELKAYAYNKEEIVNASVEFNVETLSPTYRLMLGTPGKSNALLISERLGLNESIIRYAKDVVLTSQSEVTDLINKLEKQGNTLDQKIQEYEALIHDGNRVVNDNEKLRKELIQQKADLNRKISIEQSQVIKETKDSALNLIKQLEELLSKNDLKEHEIAEMKFKVKNFNFDVEKTSSTTSHVYQVGDRVNILKFNRIGDLVKKQKNNQWMVKMGSMNSQFSEDEFDFVEEKQLEEKSKSRIKSKVVKRTSGELDLRGMRYEEARIALDKYIDDCLVSNMPFATIIHGFGTLTLRKLVKTYLDSNKAIARHRDGEGNEGGNGVTIVYFK
ncbi:MAG: endonuclease MutS2 [Bacilli bacterium]|nr:endonuclease MutS2 [Bacilli bacterium]